MSETLRLCFVADPRSVHTTRWLRFFADRGHAVMLVSAHAADASLPGVSEHRLTGQTSLPGTRLLLNAVELRDALRRFRADILHAHYINESGWIAAFSRFRPFVLTAWGSDVYVAPRASTLARLLSPWAVRRADYVTADSADQVACLRRMGAAPQRSSVVGWGVDLDLFGNGDGAAWRRRHGIAPERVVVLSPRQWVSNSNVDVILDAFASVSARRPEAFLVLKRLAGTEPSLRSSLEQRIRELRLEGQVLLVDTVTENELPDLYAAADITVSVCSSDGTPVSVLEAMASRSAVIVADLPSLREWVVDGETGFLVPARDVRALAVAVERLTADAMLRQRAGASARQAVEGRADRRRALGEMEAVYRRLASKEMRE
jgi:glycosyltransferase involved in cell wall biosynthesis